MFQWLSSPCKHCFIFTTLGTEYAYVTLVYFSNLYWLYLPFCDAAKPAKPGAGEAMRYWIGSARDMRNHFY